MSNLQKVKNARRRAEQLKIQRRQAVADLARAAVISEMERVRELHAYYFRRHGELPTTSAFDERVAELLLEGLEVHQMTQKFPGGRAVWPPEIWSALLRLL